MVVEAIAAVDVLQERKGGGWHRAKLARPAEVGIHHPGLPS